VLNISLTYLKAMKYRDLALLLFLAFATTTQGQYYENGKYGTNKSVTVYSAKYTTQPTKGLFNIKKGLSFITDSPFFMEGYKIIR
jgi:hypothetical protein